MPSAQEFEAEMRAAYDQGDYDEVERIFARAAPGGRVNAGMERLLLHAMIAKHSYRPEPVDDHRGERPEVHHEHSLDHAYGNAEERAEELIERLHRLVLTIAVNAPALETERMLASER